MLDVVALRLLLPKWKRVQVPRWEDRALALLAPAAFGGLAFVIPLRAIGLLGLIVSFPCALAGVLFGVAFNLYHFWARGRWSGSALRAEDRDATAAAEPKRSGFFRRLLP